jgi:hypothetical protein
MRKERICIVKPSLEELKAGAKLDEQIDQAIRVYDKLVRIPSKQSLQSKWVMAEIRKA